MTKENKIIIGLLSIILVIGIVGLIPTKSGSRLGAYEDSYTGYDKLKAYTDLKSDGTLTVTGASTLTGNLTANGSYNLINNLYVSGQNDAISTTSATYTLSAADICNSNIIKFTPLGSATTVTLPATSTLFSTCLTSANQTTWLSYQSVSTSTVLAAGAGGTLLTTASTTVAANKGGILYLSRDSANTYMAGFINLN